MAKKLLWIISIVAVCAITYYFIYGRGQVVDNCHATIYLQPYDDFTQKEAEKLKADLDKHLEGILDGSFEVKVLPNKPLLGSFLGETGKKYRIDKLISDLKENADEHNIYIGITNRDICRDYKNGVKDWGVLGSSIADYHACVVSDYRLKHKKRDMWKVVVHEFIHTFYGANHCPNDDPRCFMKDAKGHGNFEIQNKLCDSCKH